MAGPAIFIRNLSDDLKVEVIEFRNLFSGIVDSDFIRFQISRLVLRELHGCPAPSHSRSIFEEPSSESCSPFLPLIPFQVTDETIRLTHSASVPGSTIIGISHTERGVVPIEHGIIARDLIAKFPGLLIVIEISFAVVFSPPSSWVTGTAILDEEERGFIHFRGILIDLSGQLARIEGSQRVLPVHSGGETPGAFWIEGITDNNLPGSIGSALLEVIAPCDPVIIVTRAAGPLGTVGCFALEGKRSAIESFQNDLLVRSSLGGHGGRVKEVKKQKY